MKLNWRNAKGFIAGCLVATVVAGSLQPVTAGVEDNLKLDALLARVETVATNVTSAITTTGTTATTVATASSAAVTAKTNESYYWSQSSWWDHAADSERATKELAVDYISASKSGVYGISKDITSSSTTWTRTDDAVGYTATASKGSTVGSSDFDYCYPWSTIRRVTFDTGDVMVRIPKFYYKRWRDGNTEYIQISGQKKNGFNLHPAFYHQSVEEDCVYVGAYETSSRNKSVSGASPTTGIPRGYLRSSARGKGDGWEIQDLAVTSAIQMLMLVEYADNNVQTAIGRGNVDTTAALKTGSCDGLTYLTGVPSGTSGKTGVVYRGIENFWGNLFTCVDGVYYSYTQTSASSVGSSDNLYYITSYPSKYGDTTRSDWGTLSYHGLPADGVVSRIGLDTNYPWVMLPEYVSTSYSGYASDYVFLQKGVQIVTIGGKYENGNNAGIWGGSYCYGDASTGGAGSRLMYIP